MKDALEYQELAEVYFEGELISALQESDKYRKKNKARKEQLSKHRKQVEETKKLKLLIMEQLMHREEKCGKMEEEVIHLK